MCLTIYKKETFTLKNLAVQRFHDRKHCDLDFWRLIVIFFLRQNIFFLLSIYFLYECPEYNLFNDFCVLLLNRTLCFTIHFTMISVAISQFMLSRNVQMFIFEIIIKTSNFHHLKRNECTIFLYSQLFVRNCAIKIHILQ